MPKLLGIDYGQSKIGLAIADSETKTAVPFEIIQNSEFGIQIQQIIRSENIEKIVVGLPLNMSGEETDQTKLTLKFIEDLRLKTGIEVIGEDERLTSVQAGRVGKHTSATRLNVKLSKRGQDDAVAAMHILQTYIDRNYG